MAYSTIKRHVGACVDCTDGKPKTLTAGRCPYHYNRYRKMEGDKRKASRSTVSRFTTPIKKKSTKPKKDNELEAWFDEKISAVNFSPFCWECGAFIPEEFRRHAIAHIFPKSKFTSVKTHKYNYVVCGAGCGCHDKTHRLDTFSKMRVWKQAVQRFNTFKDLITEKHKYLTQFISYATNSQIHD